MDAKQKAGLQKKSFEIPYHGGAIWIEHLDSMGGLSELVVEKYVQDYKEFSKPSKSSFLIINLDETILTDEITHCIVETMCSCSKIRRLALVGVKRKDRIRLKKIQNQTCIAVAFFRDFERAKQWVLG